MIILVWYYHYNYCHNAKLTQMVSVNMYTCMYTKHVHKTMYMYRNWSLSDRVCMCI